MSTETRPTTHRLDLDRAAAYLLLQILVSPGWAGDDRVLLYRAGQLLERAEFEFPDRPTGPAKDAPPTAQKQAGLDLEAWGKQPSPIEDVTEKQRDACKKAVEHVAKQGAVGASTTLNRLMRTLGLAPEE